MLSSMKKFLIVPPLDGSSACVVTGCEEALKRLGHTVVLFDSSAWLSMCSALQRLPIGVQQQDALSDRAIDLIAQSILAVVECQDIEYVLAFPQSPLNSSIRKEMQKQDITTVLWMTEEYGTFPFWRKLVEGYDVVATIQHEPFISELSVLGHTPVYLPFAANGVCCTPVSTHTAAEDLIVVLGDASDELANVLTKHIDRGMVLWGDGWDAYEQFVPYYQGSLGRLTRSERKALYRDAAVIANLHSPDIGSGDAVNLETFAIAACGGFQLVDKRMLMEGMFSYEELVIFESAAELSEQLTEFVDDRNSRLEYARNAQKLVLAKHTYDHRMKTLLSELTS